MHIYCLADVAAAPAAAASTAATGTATTGTPTQGSLFNSPMVPLILMVVAFYFLLIRPQQQQAKRQAKLLSALKPGDKVSTATGIIGVVVTVKDKTVTLRSGDSKFELTKSSVTEILETGSTTEA